MTFWKGLFTVIGQPQLSQCLKRIKNTGFVVDYDGFIQALVEYLRYMVDSIRIFLLETKQEIIQSQGVSSN